MYAFSFVSLKTFRHKICDTNTSAYSGEDNNRILFKKHIGAKLIRNYERFLDLRVKLVSDISILNESHEALKQVKLSSMEAIMETMERKVEKWINKAIESKLN
jgi:predicted YcjX-like family ATPase